MAIDIITLNEIAVGVESMNKYHIYLPYNIAVLIPHGVGLVLIRRLQVQLSIVYAHIAIV